MHDFTVAIINGSYMFRLQSSPHQAVYMRSIKGNYVPLVYLLLQMIIGLDVVPTCRDIYIYIYIYIITHRIAFTM
jgi:hypothetical protein